MKKTEVLLRVTFCLGIMAFGFLCYTCVYVFADTPVRYLEEELTKDDVLRLHVIAPGDSAQDQLLKFDVRDAVINEAIQLLSEAKDISEAINICAESLDRFERVSEAVLAGKNDSRSVSAKLETSRFPDMSYGRTTLPSDEYLSLRIEIGEAEGSNWWCVLFPSLCLIDLQSAKIVQKIEPQALTKTTSVTNMQMRYELPDWVKRALSKG